MQLFLSGSTPRDRESIMPSPQKPTLCQPRGTPQSPETKGRRRDGRPVQVCLCQNHSLSKLQPFPKSGVRLSPQVPGAEGTRGATHTCTFSSRKEDGIWENPCWEWGFHIPALWQTQKSFECSTICGARSRKPRRQHAVSNVVRAKELEQTPRAEAPSLAPSSLNNSFPKQPGRTEVSHEKPKQDLRQTPTSEQISQQSPNLPPLALALAKQRQTGKSLCKQDQAGRANRRWGPLCLPKCQQNRISHTTNNNKPSHKLGKSKSHPLQIPACAATSVQTVSTQCATAMVLQPVWHPEHPQDVSGKHEKPWMRATECSALVEMSLFSHWHWLAGSKSL